MLTQALTRTAASDRAAAGLSGVTFGPAAGTVNSGLTVGSKVGGIRSLTTLGLINGVCATTITVEFVLYNVALPNNLADPRASTNIAWPRPEGSSDRFGGFSSLGLNGDHTANAGKGFFAVAGSGFAPGAVPRADGTSIAIEGYPIWLLDLLDPDFTPGNFDPLAGPVTGADGGAKPLVPLAVYGGLTFVAGSWTPLYYVQFPAGGLAVFGGAAGLMNADMGPPSVTVLGDPAAVRASPSTITDFCTPLSAETVLLGTTIGTGGGQVRATNPATAGTHFITQRTASQRDLDQDGYENSLDTCQKIVSTDPRSVSGADADGDGIDDVCDLIGDGAIDEDGDGFLNRQDNCSAVSNSVNLDSEINVSISSAQADLGPRADGIGDACDSGVVTVASQNGHGPFDITLSPTVANGRYHIQHNVIAKCFGGLTDADGDGYCAGSDDTNDTATAQGLAQHGAWFGTHPGQQIDTDGDGWSDALETYFGTDPVFACSANTTKNNEPINNWPLDLNDDGRVTVFDIVPFIASLGHYVGSSPAAVPGLDFKNDGKINVFDVVPFISTLNHTCDLPAGDDGMGFAPWSQQ